MMMTNSVKRTNQTSPAGAPAQRETKSNADEALIEEILAAAGLEALD